jgi:hypothetical protein
MKTIAYLASLAVIVLPLSGIAQEQATVSQSVDVRNYGDFELDEWVYDAKRVAVGWSRQFDKANEMIQTLGRGTVAYPRNLRFKDGVIECDMAGGAYLGISFRIRDVDGKRLSEDIYFRLLGNQRPKTVQYYPHGKLKQDELHRPPYEQAIRPIEQNEWFHVRIEVQGRQARVFLDGRQEPVQVIDDLMHDHTEGSVGVRSWGGRFANLNVTLTEAVVHRAN